MTTTVIFILFLVLIAVFGVIPALLFYILPDIIINRERKPMCRIDNADGHCELLKDTTPKARKEYKCCECYRIISIGEQYSYHFTVFDGTTTSYRTCRHCVVVRDIIWHACHGYIYGEIQEEMREHTIGGYFKGHGSWAYRICVGMNRKWRRKDGTLMPVSANQKHTETPQ